MYDLFLVRVMNGITDRAKKFQALGDVQFIVVAIVIERLPLDVFHDEVGQTILGRPTVKQPGDVWMIQGSEYLSFFAEATQDEVCVHPAFDEFDGGSLVELIIGA